MKNIFCCLQGDNDDNTITLNIHSKCFNKRKKKIVITNEDHIKQIIELLEKISNKNDN